MYKSVEAIEKLRREKIRILESVYTEPTISAVYQKQTLLNSMSMNIYTDAAAAIIDTLELDGASKRLVPVISGRLGELRFKSVPPESEVDDAYDRSINGSAAPGNNDFNYVSENGGSSVSKKGSVHRIRGKMLPQFLIALAVQGIGIPLLINKCSVLVKVLVLVGNGVLMTVEVIKYYQWQKKKTVEEESRSEGYHEYMERKRLQNGQQTSTRVKTRDDMKREAIEQVRKDNLEELNSWFDSFVRITEEEINRAVSERRGTQ